MTPKPEFVALLNTIDDTREKMRKLSVDQPAGWKTEYAKLRPLFQQQTAEAIAMTKDWLRQKGDPALEQKYVELLDHASARLAAHQARWPVLVLDGNNPDYMASFREVNANFDKILIFVRGTLKG